MYHSIHILYLNVLSFCMKSSKIITQHLVSFCLLFFTSLLKTKLFLHISITGKENSTTGIQSVVPVTAISIPPKEKENDISVWKAILFYRTKH